MSLKTMAIVRIAAACLGASLLAAAPLRAGEKTDVLYMKNGDRLTCEIKTLSAGVLQVSLDYVDGTISLDWLAIDSLNSKRLFIVMLEDGSVYTGKLVIASTVPGGPAKLKISSGPGSFVLIDKEEVVTLGETSDDFWRRFAVSISSGIIFTKANNSAQYNLSSSITYPRPRWSASLLFNSALSTASGLESSTRNQLDLGAYHLLPPKNWFYAGQATLLQSTEQSIDLRTGIGGSIGRYVANTEHFSLSFGGGLGWQNTQYAQSVSSAEPEDILALLISGDMRLVKFKRTKLTASFTALPALSDPGRFFFNTNADIFFKLFSNFSLTFTFYGNWDTRPPPTFSGSDYGFTTGLGWTIGNPWTQR
jgi:hypothetical protein